MQHRIVDTHIHIWNFARAEYAWLKGNTSILGRTYEITELEQERKRAGITDGVLMQAANNLEETDYMLEVAAASDWIKGVVGWLPLMNPKAFAVALKDYHSIRYFKGIRHLIHDEADPRWLLQENVIESLGILADHDLPYDVVGVSPAHIETTLVVSEKVPNLKIVFDHLNQPPIVSKEKFGEWGRLMKRAAENKNFYAKISGLGTTSQKKEWTKEDIEPYVEFVLQHFGAERCFCGADWPVSLLSSSYAHTWSVYREVLDSLLNEEQRMKVYYQNAVDFYHL